MGKAVEADLIVGVDTHLDTHTAALCDARGRTVSQLQVAATSAGYAQLLVWADSAAAGRPVAWAIEGTRHYGLAWPATWRATAARSLRSTPPGTWAGAARARVTRSMPSARPASCWPASIRRRCAPMANGRSCGC